MTWIVTDDINDTINVRAVLHLPSQQNELREFIAALQKRVKPEEKTDDRRTS